MIRSITHISEELMLGIWDINEPLDVLTAQLSTEEFAVAQKYHPNKKAEFAASRLLIKAMCQETHTPYQGMVKDEHGKPHFVDGIHHLSISHSHPMVAGLIHKNRPCGIDIESPRDQLIRIKHKYLNDAELTTCGEDLDRLCLYWCAKETVYKIYGRTNLSLRSDIFITEVGDDWLNTQVQINDELKTLTLHYGKLDGYFLVYGYGQL